MLGTQADSYARKWASSGSVLLRVDQGSRNNGPESREGGRPESSQNWPHKARIWTIIGAAGAI